MGVVGDLFGAGKMFLPQVNGVDYWRTGLQMGRRTHGWMNRQTDRQTDRVTWRQTDRQTDKLPDSWIWFLAETCFYSMLTNQIISTGNQICSSHEESCRSSDTIYGEGAWGEIGPDGTWIRWWWPFSKFRVSSLAICEGISSQLLLQVKSNG